MNVHLQQFQIKSCNEMDIFGRKSGQMNILSIRDVTKKYHNHLAVDRVSFDMEKGSLLGLLGPNGAGKTSLIRIITTITQADSGVVLFADQPLDHNHPAQIGYLPEERGLYKKMKVGEQLLYLAQLKGLKPGDARDSIEMWLEKFEIGDWWNKKIEELSKGMQQKIQFVSTIVHRPKLIILDEPFSGLDPINTNLIKEQIGELNAAGTSVIFSTHRMEQVEEICEDIVLINQGKNILSGNVNEIKEQYKQHQFKISYLGEVPAAILEDDRIIEHNNGTLTVQVEDLAEANRFVKALLDNHLMIKDFTEILPTLNDIFIRTVTERNEQTLVDHQA